MALVFAENIPLVEPVPIEDELCSGLARIEDVGGIAARFVLYHVQTLYEVGATAFVVKRKIILPYEAIPPSIEMAVGYMARRSGDRLLRLVTPLRDATFTRDCGGRSASSERDRELTHCTSLRPCPARSPGPITAMCAARCCARSAARVAR